MSSRPPHLTRFLAWMRAHLSRLAATRLVAGVRALMWKPLPCLVLTLTLFTLALLVTKTDTKVPPAAEVTLTQVVKDLDKGRVIEVAWTDGDEYEAAATAVVVTDDYSKAVKVPAAYAEKFMADVVDHDVLVTHGSVPASKPGHPVDPADAVPAEGPYPWVGAVLWILFGLCGFWTVYSRSVAHERGNPRARRTSLLGRGRGLDTTVETDIPTRFSDVAGCAEAVADLSEMVEYLQDPARFTRLGAKTPRGALLAGPPGTGKTLLARAVAGEAGVAFISVSGSDFVEKYVGVGAQRIREVFAKARTHEKAIVFIDEVDTIARRRSTGGEGGASQEIENTLTALLTELDGFADRGNVLVLAATNRAELLDEAVVRPGRLERRINVPNPDRYGREQILAVHAKGRPIAADVDLTSIARRTPGFSGAQMEAIVNEACMIAARGGRDDVNQACFDFAVATIAMGRARESALVTEFDRKVTAWHEAGHALCAYLINDADDPVQITIVPRGPAGGVTWMSGSDDVYLRRRTAHARLVVAMGGRVGEELLLDGEYTQGASGDLISATQTATQMVTQYGMTDLGYVVRDGDNTPEVLAAVNRLLEDAHARATDLLTANRAFMTAVVEALLEEETLTLGDIEAIAAEHGVARVESFALPPVPVRKSVADLTAVLELEEPVAPLAAATRTVPSRASGRGVLSRLTKGRRVAAPITTAPITTAPVDMTADRAE